MVLQLEFQLALNIHHVINAAILIEDLFCTGQTGRGGVTKNGFSVLALLNPVASEW
jgi:hypothetical protein